MDQVLARLKPSSSNEVLVDATTGDDAAVLKFGDRAIVFTVDFITPLVDDPFNWGRIAAANSASDVYAMGGIPKFALNIVAWNNDDLPDSILVEVLKGAESVARQGGWITVGGHTVTDKEPKFGLSVIGEADPSRLLRNSGLKTGDTIVLTKPIGTGIITTAIKSGVVTEYDRIDVIEQMAQLNDIASRAALLFGSEAATDVTGFGLLGHLYKMSRASHVAIELSIGSVPIIEGVADLVRLGQVPSGSKRNLAWVEPHLQMSEDLKSGSVLDDTLLMLADAQTSGGLCIALEANKVDQAISWLSERSVSAWPIAKVGGYSEDGQIEIVP